MLTNIRDTVAFLPFLQFSDNRWHLCTPQLLTTFLGSFAKNISFIRRTLSKITTVNKDSLPRYIVGGLGGKIDGEKSNITEVSPTP